MKTSKGVSQNLSAQKVQAPDTSLRERFDQSALQQTDIFASKLGDPHQIFDTGQNVDHQMIDLEITQAQVEANEPNQEEDERSLQVDHIQKSPEVKIGETSQSPTRGAGLGLQDVSVAEPSAYNELQRSPDSGNLPVQQSVKSSDSLDVKMKKDESINQAKSKESDEGQFGLEDNYQMLQESQKSNHNDYSKSQKSQNYSEQSQKEVDTGMNYHLDFDNREAEPSGQDFKKLDQTTEAVLTYKIREDDEKEISQDREGEEEHDKSKSEENLADMSKDELSKSQNDTSKAQDEALNLIFGSSPLLKDHPKKSVQGQSSRNRTPPVSSKQETSQSGQKKLSSKQGVHQSKQQAQGLQKKSGSQNRGSTPLGNSKSKQPNQQSGQRSKVTAVSSRSSKIHPNFNRQSLLQKQPNSRKIQKSNLSSNKARRANNINTLNVSKQVQGANQGKVSSKKDSSNRSRSRRAGEGSSSRNQMRRNSQGQTIRVGGISSSKIIGSRPKSKITSNGLSSRCGQGQMVQKGQILSSHKKKLGPNPQQIVKRQQPIKKEDFKGMASKDKSNSMSANISGMNYKNDASPSKLNDNIGQDTQSQTPFKTELKNGEKGETVTIKLRDDYVENAFLHSQSHHQSKLQYSGAKSDKNALIQAEIHDPDLNSNNNACFPMSLDDMQINELNEISLKRSRQVRNGRPIWQIMELIKIYRDGHCNGTNLTSSYQVVKDFCKRTNMDDVSRKMLDEYWSTIQKAYQFGFDVDSNQFQNFGVVKNFVNSRIEAMQKRDSSKDPPCVDDLFTKDKKDSLMNHFGIQIEDDSQNNSQQNLDSQREDSLHKPNERMKLDVRSRSVSQGSIEQKSRAKESVHNSNKKSLNYVPDESQYPNVPHPNYAPHQSSSSVHGGPGANIAGAYSHPNTQNSYAPNYRYPQGQPPPYSASTLQPNYPPPPHQTPQVQSAQSYSNQNLDQNLSVNYHQIHAQSESYHQYDKQQHVPAHTHQYHGNDASMNPNNSGFVEGSNYNYDQYSGPPEPPNYHHQPHPQYHRNSYQGPQSHRSRENSMTSHNFPPHLHYNHQRMTQMNPSGPSSQNRQPLLNAIKQESQETHIRQPIPMQPHDKLLVLHNKMLHHIAPPKKDESSIQEINEICDERSSIKQKLFAPQPIGQKHPMLQSKMPKIKQESQKVHKDHQSSRHESHHKHHSHRPIEYEDVDSHRGSEMHHQQKILNQTPFRHQQQPGPHQRHERKLPHGIPVLKRSSVSKKQSLMPELHPRDFNDHFRERNDQMMEQQHRHIPQSRHETSSYSNQHQPYRQNPPRQENFQHPSYHHENGSRGMQRHPNMIPPQSRINNETSAPSYSRSYNNYPNIMPPPHQNYHPQSGQSNQMQMPQQPSNQNHQAQHYQHYQPQMHRSSRQDSFMQNYSEPRHQGYSNQHQQNYRSHNGSNHGVHNPHCPPPHQQVDNLQYAQPAPPMQQQSAAQPPTPSNSHGHQPHLQPNSGQPYNYNYSNQSNPPPSIQSRGYSPQYQPPPSSYQSGDHAQFGHQNQGYQPSYGFVNQPPIQYSHGMKHEETQNNQQQLGHHDGMKGRHHHHGIAKQPKLEKGQTSHNQMKIQQ